DTGSRLVPISYGEGKQPAKDGKQLFVPGQQGKDSKKGAPITITAFGNKMIVTSEDTKALKLIQELALLLTRTNANEGDFEIIHLKYASAIDVSRVLDEAFNGPRPTGGMGGGRGGPGGGRGGGPGG